MPLLCMLSGPNAGDSYEVKGVPSRFFPIISKTAKMLLVLKRRSLKEVPQ